MKLARLTASLICLLTCSLAQAASQGNYDTFDSKGLDSSRWVESDFDGVRSAVAGVAHLGKRSLGSASSDTGAVFDIYPLSFANAALLTSIAADVVIDNATAVACSANPMAASTKLRLGGAFFNAGTPTSGSALGDVVAQVVWARTSDSVDADDQLRLVGSVQRCTNNDCSASKPVGSSVDLGLVNLGRKARVAMRWNPAVKAFVFRRDAGIQQSVTYTDDDTTPATKPAKSFSVRNVAPNCASDERGEAGLSVRIDNVQVNASAAP